MINKTPEQTKSELLKMFFETETKGWDNEMHDKYDSNVNEDFNRWYEGYQFAATQFQPPAPVEGKEVYVFVKASDRTPDKEPDKYTNNQILSCRFNNHKGIKIPGTATFDNGVFYFDGISPRGKDEFENIEWLSLLTPLNESGKNYWVEIPVSERLPGIDDVYSVISAGDNSPVERRLELSTKRWLYPYERGVDKLYDNGVKSWLERTPAPVGQEAKIDLAFNGDFNKGYKAGYKDGKEDADYQQNNKL